MIQRLINDAMWSTSRENQRTLITDFLVNVFLTLRSPAEFVTSSTATEYGTQGPQTICRIENAIKLFYFFFIFIFGNVL